MQRIYAYCHFMRNILAQKMFCNDPIMFILFRQATSFCLPIVLLTRSIRDFWQTALETCFEQNVFSPFSPRKVLPHMSFLYERKNDLQIQIQQQINVWMRCTAWVRMHCTGWTRTLQACKSMRLLCSVFFRFVCVRAALKMDAEKQECCKRESKLLGLTLRFLSFLS